MWNPQILHGYKRRAAYTLIWCFCAMLLVGATAVFTKAPFIFPSLGPTALMIFAHPLRRESSPRHVLIGHAIGAGSGYFALWITGLLAVPFSAMVDGHRVLAAAMALGLTAALMTLAKAEHAPAGATTLIVALGIMPHPLSMLPLMAAVVMLTAFGLGASRLSGIDYPVWTPVHRVARVAHLE